jgi:hypothetical protein
VLDPGRGRTKTGQLWAYARDDRPWGGTDPPGVVYVYAPDRKAERPIAHLAGFKGILQVDGYGGYRALAENGDVALAFCWSHVRRRFYELAAARAAAIACVLPFLRASMNRLTWRSVMWPPGIRPPHWGEIESGGSPTGHPNCRPAVILIVAMQRPTTDQPAPHTMNGLEVELRLALQGHEPHGRPLHRLGTGLGIAVIVLVGLTKGFMRRHQPCLITDRLPSRLGHQRELPRLIPIWTQRSTKWALLTAIHRDPTIPCRQGGIGI